LSIFQDVEQASKRSTSVTTEWNKWRIVKVSAVHQNIYAHQQGISTGFRFT